jgi:acyl dehydratase
MPVEIDDYRKLEDMVGREVAVSDWIEVSQKMIDVFAENTHDHQWIHVDVERSRKESPFGTTVAHGFLTLSLLAPIAYSAMRVGGAKYGVNYGFNRVRFTGPVPSGSRIRGRFKLKDYKKVDGGAETNFEVTVEREGGDRPVCVAEWLTRRYG